MWFQIPNLSCRSKFLQFAGLDHAGGSQLGAAIAFEPRRQPLLLQRIVDGFVGPRISVDPCISVDEKKALDYITRWCRFLPTVRLVAEHYLDKKSVEGTGLASGGQSKRVRFC